MNGCRLADRWQGWRMVQALPSLPRAGRRLPLWHQRPIGLLPPAVLTTCPSLRLRAQPRQLRPRYYRAPTPFSNTVKYKWLWLWETLAIRRRYDAHNWSYSFTEVLWGGLCQTLPEKWHEGRQEARWQPLMGPSATGGKDVGQGEEKTDDITRLRT